MIYFSVDGRITTFSLGNPMVGYPKIISSSIAEHDIVVRTPDELTQVTANDNDPVIEPVRDTIITTTDGEFLITLGRDYSSCVITTPTKTVIVGSKVPQPNLEVFFTAQGYPRLRWTSSFLTPTKIYRTNPIDVLITNDDYILIAEIDQVTVPDTAGVYIDTSFGPLASGQKVSYYVENANGVSNTVEAIR